MTRVLIMAVPWLPVRTKRAVELSNEAGQPAEIIWDQTQNAFDTWRLVLRAAGPDPVIIIEDDVILTERWREKIEAAVSERPDDVIQFFSMRGADVTVGSRYEPGRTFLMNQCYYLPPGVAQALLAFSEDWVEKNPEFKTGYDVTMARWMQQEKRHYWLHVPSLVQHLDWKSEIHPNRPRNRQSGTFR